MLANKLSKNITQIFTIRWPQNQIKINPYQKCQFGRTQSKSEKLLFYELLNYFRKNAVLKHSPFSPV